MSGGRVELGIGAGWFEAEHRAYGIPFPPLAERFARLEEQLQIITGLWTTPTGTPFSFKGRFYEITARPGCPSPCSSRARRSSSAAAVRGARQTWRRASRTSSTSPSSRSTTSAERFRACRGVPGRRPRAELDGLLQRAHGCLLGRPGDAQPSRSGDRSQARRAARARPVRHHQPRCSPGWRGTRRSGSQRAYLQVLDLHDLDHIRELADGGAAGCRQLIRLRSRNGNVALTFPSAVVAPRPSTLSFNLARE